MIYPRKLTKNLIEEISSRRITILTGMRQTGKTTLLRYIFDQVNSENKIFLDLENPLNQKIFEEKNYDNILLNLKEFGIDPDERSYIFLDEIQLMPDISRAIKYLHDHYQIKFFLTGSCSFYFKNLFPESLAGRKIIYELFPLDFEEFLIFKGKERKIGSRFNQKAKNKNIISFDTYKNLYEEFLKYGGFPGVVIEKKKKEKIIEDIFTSYFEKDVKTLGDFREIKQLRDVIILLANRVSSKIDISKISREMGVSRETIYSYLSFLEKTYFLFLISPFSRSLNGEVRGAKKIYFCDTGILNYIGKNTPGVIFENAVFLSLKNYGTVNYFQKYKGPEIDFILNQSIAFEVKIFGELGDIQRLSKISRSIGIKKYFLITKNYLNHKNAIPGLNL